MTWPNYFNPDTDWMNAAETSHFKRMRDSGRITFFRIDRCARCGGDIIKGKRFCSKQCKEEVMGEFTWEIDLDNLIGQKVRVETTDGMYREGPISNFNFIEFSFLGKTVKIPEWLELDGDASNRFDINRLAKVEQVR